MSQKNKNSNSRPSSGILYNFVFLIHTNNNIVSCSTIMDKRSHSPNWPDIIYSWIIANKIPKYLRDNWGNKLLQLDNIKH